MPEAADTRQFIHSLARLGRTNYCLLSYLSIASARVSPAPVEDHRVWLSQLRAFRSIFSYSLAVECFILAVDNIAITLYDDLRKVG